MLNVVKEQITDYATFVSLITNKVKENIGEEYDVKIYKVIKNNSMELDSLIIRKKGKNSAPNIYLKPYYEAFLEGVTIEELADRLYELYQRNSKQVQKDDFNYTFEEMKSHIIYRLVNCEKNRKLLSTTPHLKYLDLAITFHCLVRNDEEGIGTIRITNEHLKLWNASLEDLTSYAKNNTYRLFPPSIRSMEEVLQGLLNEELACQPELDFSEDDIHTLFHNPTKVNHHKMYILSNKKGINGASCLLYKNVLSKFAGQVDSDLYILPSSIHELILIPYSPDIKKEALLEMVRDVNRTQVADEEVLSDRVYYYSKVNKKITVL